MSNIPKGEMTIKLLVNVEVPSVCFNFSFALQVCLHTLQPPHDKSCNIYAISRNRAKQISQKRSFKPTLRFTIGYSGKRSIIYNSMRLRLKIILANDIGPVRNLFAKIWADLICRNRLSTQTCILSRDILILA